MNDDRETMRPPPLEQDWQATERLLVAARDRAWQAFREADLALSNHRCGGVISELVIQRGAPIGHSEPPRTVRCPDGVEREQPGLANTRHR